MKKLQKAIGMVLISMFIGSMGFWSCGGGGGGGGEDGGGGSNMCDTWSGTFVESCPGDPQEYGGTGTATTCDDGTISIIYMDGETATGTFSINGSTMEASIKEGANTLDITGTISEDGNTVTGTYNVVETPCSGIFTMTK
ncbi:MAG: hypothetical protein MI862_18525 [Desulfobacterales bacterium]|nr:hypothetical protein [Desulfobacterales bacterium]